MLRTSARLVKPVQSPVILLARRYRSDKFKKVVKKFKAAPRLHVEPAKEPRNDWFVGKTTVPDQEVSWSRATLPRQDTVSTELAELVHKTMLSLRSSEHSLAFELEVMNALQSFTPQDVRLEDLILPTPKTLVNTAHALLSPSPPSLITTFFKDSTPQSALHKLATSALKHHTSLQTARTTPPQKLTVDLSNPAEWYPAARRLKRHLILHVGPTNSGKTYNALQRLKEKNNGVYCGPLRLLAREVYNRFKSEGLRCNLITGEEVIHDLDEFGTSAPLSCSTVEMVSLGEEFEVAVIDEIQMMSSSDRGHAWTNALLGVRAKEVHLCGEASVVPLIKRIAAVTGDEVTVKEYNRLGELRVEKTPVVGGLSGLKRGDCVVVFSKKRILAYKADIERTTKLKVAVIYGALPAETRAEQAKKFNEGECDVLVASDAIGMGLNLKIRRVIFDSHQKYNGKKSVDIEIPHIKQIAGRAGRFRVAPSSTQSAQASEQENNETVGYVSAFYEDSLQYVKKCVEHPTIMLDKAVIWPSDEVLSQYISEFPADTPRASIMKRFTMKVAQSPLYSVGSCDDGMLFMNTLRGLKDMLLADLLKVVNAPLSTRLPEFTKVLHEMGVVITDNLTKTCFDLNSLDFSVLHKEVFTYDDLGPLEELHKYLLVWLWMNNRYPSLFVNKESTVDAMNLIEEKIEDILSGMKMKRIG